MAEDSQPRRSHGGETVKLFVGQVPKQMTEAQLLLMFNDIAIVKEVNVLKDKTTRKSRGCCFVICPSREEADKVVDECHYKRTLPGASHPLQVKYADGELERLEPTLFVGMLPKNVSEAEVSELFSRYGTITDLQILEGSPETRKGCAFLKYEAKEQAVAAIEALSGKHKMEGSTARLVVKWADTEKKRQARKAQKVHSPETSVRKADPQPTSLYGGLPMGYMPTYNGYVYQTPGTYGLVQYHLQPVQTQHAFQYLIPPVNHDNPMPGVQIMTGGYMQPGYYYSIPGGVPYPVPCHGGIISKSPSCQSPGYVKHLSADTPVASSIVKSPGGHLEGPPGANLFIFDIPQEFGDKELADAFKPYGRIVSATVYVDRAGVSKRFGFVSYDSPVAAEMAINTMNGCELGGKKLKVEHKKA